VSRARQLTSPQAVADGLAEIRRFADAGDHEHAHTLEDALFLAVLHAIAWQPELPAYRMRGLARTALKSRKISFARWTS